MKIANIIYENELVNHKEVEYVQYYKGPIEYDKLQEMFEHENLHEVSPLIYRKMPTLYVGWSFMKASNPDNQIIQHADILKKKIISNELYWECSFEESKSSHINGVENFVQAVPQLYFPHHYTYVNLDPVFFQIADIDGLMDVLPRQIGIMYKLKDEMLYVMANDKNIWGINLKMYEFFKFDIPEIIKRIEERTDIKYSDDEGIFYQDQYKIHPNFTHLKRYLITILAK